MHQTPPPLNPPPPPPPPHQHQHQHQPYAPQGGYAQTYPAPTNSAAAVTSFVTGLLSVIPCVGFVTIPISLITGLVGLFTAGAPGKKGRWMAVMGILLSLTLGVVVNGGLIAGGIWGANKAQQVAADLQAFGNEIEAATTALSEGDTGPIMQFVDEEFVTEDDLLAVTGAFNRIGPNVDAVEEPGNQPQSGERPEGGFFFETDQLFRGDNGELRLTFRLEGPGFLQYRDWKLTKLEIEDEAAQMIEEAAQDAGQDAGGPANPLE